MESSQKPILVTGATGFLASHCVQQLLALGYKVRGTVRSLANKNKNKFLYELVPEKNSNLELVEADLLKPETWPAVVEGCIVVVAAAAPPAPGACCCPCYWSCAASISFSASLPSLSRISLISSSLNCYDATSD